MKLNFKNPEICIQRRFLCWNGPCCRLYRNSSFDPLIHELQYSYYLKQSTVKNLNAWCNKVQITTAYLRNVYFFLWSSVYRATMHLNTALVIVTWSNFYYPCLLTDSQTNRSNIETMKCEGTLFMILLDTHGLAVS